MGNCLFAGIVYLNSAFVLSCLLTCLFGHFGAGLVFLFVCSLSPEYTYTCCRFSVFLGDALLELEGLGLCVNLSFHHCIVSGVALVFIKGCCVFVFVFICLWFSACLAFRQDRVASAPRRLIFSVLLHCIASLIHGMYAIVDKNSTDLYLCMNLTDTFAVLLVVVLQSHISSSTLTTAECPPDVINLNCRFQFNPLSPSRHLSVRRSRVRHVHPPRIEIWSAPGHSTS